MNALDENKLYILNIIKRVGLNIELAKTAMVDHKVNVGIGSVGPVSQKLSKIRIDLTDDLEYLSNIISSKGCFGQQWEELQNEAFALFVVMDKMTEEPDDPLIKSISKKLRIIITKKGSSPESMSSEVIEVLKNNQQLKIIQQTQKSDLFTMPKNPIGDPLTSSFMLLAILFDFYHMRLWKKK